MSKIVLNPNWRRGDSTGTGSYVVYGNGIYVSLGGGQYVHGSTATTGIKTSTDGLNWTTRTTDQWNCLAYGNGIFVAYNNTQYGISTNGITWTKYTIDTRSYIVSPNFTCVSYVGGGFVAISATPDVYKQQSFTHCLDGSGNLASHSLTGNGIFPTNSRPYAVAYGNGRFVTVLSANGGYPISFNIFYNIMTTTITFTNSDGSISPYWSSYQNDIITLGEVGVYFNWVIFDGFYNNKKFVAVGPDNIATSTDGLTWSLVNTNTTAGDFYGIHVNWQSVIYVSPASPNLQSYYVATSDNGYIGYSQDAVTWYMTGSTLSSPYRWMSITQGANNIVATGNSNNLLTNIIDVKCFLEGSKILCSVDGEEKYVEIQNLRKGDLVKTLLNGYKAVDLIGSSKIYNPANKLRNKARLYKLTPEKYPELTEDLVITGCHSILIDEEMTEDQRAKSFELMGDIFITEDRYRLLACIDERAEPYDQEGIHTIWHFSLEHHFEKMNYGVYANGGLMVETSSKRMMREQSGLEIIS